MQAKPIVRGLLVGGLGVALLTGCAKDDISSFLHAANAKTTVAAATFIIGSDSVILTNAHVVDGAKDVTVKLIDKREFEAKRGRANGRMGVDGRPLTPEGQKQLGVSDGLLVNDAAGPAAAADIQSGDAILGADGAPVESVEQLQILIKAHDQVARYWSAAKTQPCLC